MENFPRRFNRQFSVNDWGLTQAWEVDCYACNILDMPGILGFKARDGKGLCEECLKEIIEDHTRSNVCGVSMEEYIETWMITQRLSGFNQTHWIEG